MVSVHGGPDDTADDIAADVDRLGRLWLQDRERPARRWIASSASVELEDWR